MEGFAEDDLLLELGNKSLLAPKLNLVVGLEVLYPAVVAVGLVVFVVLRSLELEFCC